MTKVPWKGVARGWLPQDCCFKAPDVGLSPLFSSGLEVGCFLAQSTQLGRLRDPTQGLLETYSSFHSQEAE